MIFHNLIVLDFISKFVHYTINISIDYFIILISIATIRVVIVLFSTGKESLDKFLKVQHFVDKGLDQFFGAEGSQDKYRVRGTTGSRSSVSGSRTTGSRS